MEDGGIEPLRHRCRTTVFKAACRPFSGIFHKTEAGGVEPLQLLTALLCSRQVAVLSAAASKILGVWRFLKRLYY